MDLQQLQNAKLQSRLAQLPDTIGRTTSMLETQRGLEPYSPALKQATSRQSAWETFKEDVQPRIGLDELTGPVGQSALVSGLALSTVAGLPGFVAGAGTNLLAEEGTRRMQERLGDTTGLAAGVGLSMAAGAQLYTAIPGAALIDLAEEGLDAIPANRIKQLMPSLGQAQDRQKIWSVEKKVTPPIEYSGPNEVQRSWQQPFDNDFNTTLTPAEEQAFQRWHQTYAPLDSGADYDLRGAYKAKLKPDAQTGHWPDTFKKPNHETFSDESQYAPYGHPGHWQGDTYIPPLKLGGFKDVKGQTRNVQSRY